jgi:hypothetical protein
MTEQVKRNRIPETAQEAIVRLETALEHASHAWAALRKAEQIPDRPHIVDGWPPMIDWQLRDVGTTPYHLAALINGTWEVYQGLLKNSEVEEFRNLDEGYGEVPEG